MKHMRIGGGIGRDVAIVILTNVVVLAAPCSLRADPMTPRTASPLTVTTAGDSEMSARRMANRARILEGRLAELHAGLQLSPAQEKLWPPVADAIRDLDKARGFRFRAQLEAAPSRVDGLKMQGDHMAAMGAAMATLATATKPLLADLSADQKSRLPGLLQRIRPRKILARAFDVPLDDNATAATQPKGWPTQGAAIPAPGASTNPTPPPAKPAAPDDPDDD